ncbi:MAG: VOC family protein [Caulobacteraceae bacterium]|nr:VOC family protein [Caulobacteraceae bacterium]
MTARISAWLAVVFGVLLNGGGASADPAKSGDLSAGRVTGIGGVFFKSKDPKALAAWYRDVLGLKIENWGGAALSYEAPRHPPVVVWGPFPESTDYMTPSKREFMVNFAVDDLDAFLAKLAGKGVTILKRDDKDPSGKFAWILDPDGTKIELWQAKPSIPRQGAGVQNP